MPFPNIGSSGSNRARFAADQHDVGLPVFFKTAASQIGAPNKQVDLCTHSEQVKLRMKDLGRIQSYLKSCLALPSLKKTGIGVMERAADNQFAHFCPHFPKKVLHSFVRFSRPGYGNLNVVCAVQ